MLRWWANVVAVGALAGCGGGDSGGSDAVCSDFRYQEDAQAAFSSGARQLDGDRDGIACESLPHRPASVGSGGSSGQVPSAVAYNLMSALGEVIALVPASSGRYSMSVWGPFESVADIGPLNSSTANSVTQVASNFVSVRYGLKSGELVPVWSSHGSAVPSGAGGIGFSPVAQSLTSISGTYRAIGQACQQGRAPCTPLVGTLVVAEGNVAVCAGQDATVSTCAPSVTLPVSRTTSDPEGVFTLDHISARLLVSASGSLALSYQNVYESASHPNPAFVRTTWFGIRQGQESQTALSATAFEGFANTGVLAYSVAGSWALQDNQPFSRLRRDAAGRLALRSSNGLLITWSPEGGLQTFLQR